MKIDLNYFPYWERIKKAPIEERLDIACEYIDFTLNQYFKYSMQMTFIQTKRLFLKLDENWNTLCNKDILVYVSEEGEEYTLDFEVLPEMVAQRTLQRARFKSDFDGMKDSLGKIFKSLEWSQDILSEVSYDV